MVNIYFNNGIIGRNYFNNTLENLNRNIPCAVNLN